MSTDYKTAGVRERLGYRGLVLVWFGFLYFFIGLSILFDHTLPTPTLPHTMLPIPVRFGLWAVSAGVAIVGGVLNIWTTKMQIPAFFCLIMPAAERAFSFSASVILEYQRMPGETWIEGIPGNRLAGACVYTLITVGLLLAASWPEPVHRYSVNLKNAVQGNELLVIDDEALANLRLLDEEENSEEPELGGDKNEQ